jgi:hypothetical protein
VYKCLLVVAVQVCGAAGACRGCSGRTVEVSRSGSLKKNCLQAVKDDKGAIIAENLAHVKWVSMRLALFDPSRARLGTAGNRPGLARSTSHVVLGSGRQSIGRA